MRWEYLLCLLMMMYELGLVVGKVMSDCVVDGSLNCVSDYSLLKYLGRSFLMKLVVGEEEEGVWVLFEDGVGIGDVVGVFEDVLGVFGILNMCIVFLSFVI